MAEVLANDIIDSNKRILFWGASASMASFVESWIE
jgi:hypothetical protein